MMTMMTTMAAAAAAAVPVAAVVAAATVVPRLGEPPSWSDLPFSQRPVLVEVGTCVEDLCIALVRWGSEKHEGFT